MASVADVAIEAMRAHTPQFSWPEWGCSCGLSFGSRGGQRGHQEGMVRMALDALGMDMVPQIVSGLVNSYVPRVCSDQSAHTSHYWPVGVPSFYCRGAT